MKFLDNLGIVWKISLIVAVLGSVLAVVVMFGTAQLASTSADFSDLIGQQTASIDALRAQRRLETYHAALYAILTETTDEGNAKRMKVATEAESGITKRLEDAGRESPNLAGEIGPLESSIKLALSICDPVLDAGAKATTTEDNARVADRAHKECDPAIEKALAAIQNFSQQTLARVSDRRAAVLADAAATRHQLMMVGGVGFLLGMALALFIGLKSMSAPIARLKAAMERLANNDLTAEVPGTARHDEIGSMAKTVEVFKSNGLEVERLRSEREASERRSAEQRRREMNDLASNFEQAVGRIVETVSSASIQLETSAGSMSSTAERSKHRATMVASAAEEASANVQSVASATEELSSSV